ncbi:glucose-6-phosphate isomerase, partial [bacterium]|nr:glucose-6-phosphate isomerase [bacterium]
MATRPDLDKTRAWKTLHKLAQKPLDLTADLDWPARIDTLQSDACGYRLLYATQRVTPKVVDTLQTLAEESGAVRQFGQMMRGAKMNHVKGRGNENRQVLHTASRNIFPRLACRHDAKQADAVVAAKKQLRALKGFLDKVDSGKIANAKGQTFTD